MSKYVYKNPIEQGYIKFKLTKKQHNQLFKYRQIKWCDKYEYYYNEHYVILHKFYNKKSIILATILFPIWVLLNGLVNIKETWIELIKLYNQKKYGSFGGDDVSNGSETYDKIMKIISS